MPSIAGSRRGDCSGFTWAAKVDFGWARISEGKSTGVSVFEPLWQRMSPFKKHLKIVGCHYHAAVSGGIVSMIIDRCEFA